MPENRPLCPVLTYKHAPIVQWGMFSDCFKGFIKIGDISKATFKANFIHRFLGVSKHLTGLIDSEFRYHLNQCFSGHTFKIPAESCWSEVCYLGN